MSSPAIAAMPQAKPIAISPVEPPNTAPTPIAMAIPVRTTSIEKAAFRKAQRP
jgi:hypothetical protein